MSNNDRLFKIPEAVLLEYAEVVAELYPANAEEFIAFDSTFTAEYGNAIKESIAAVKTQKSDQIVMNEMAECTQKVLDAMSDCNHAYKSISYFVRKAFKDNEAVQNQFGFRDLHKVRNSQAKLIYFMEEHAEITAEYKNELLAEGCNAMLIDSLFQKAERLKTANIEQEKFKKERGVLTQDRSQLLNKVYGLVKPLSDVARIIFSDDEAQLAKYSLPKPKSSQNSSDDLIES
ncbi:hypothetical protein [Ancylomarina longa]|nr:hypothetical protein [Ancylomarina longa]